MRNAFDDFAKALASSSISRRETLRRMGGGLMAAAFGGIGVACDSPEIPTSPSVDPDLRFGVTPQAAGCKADDSRCKTHTDCCTGYCDPNVKTCGCKSGTTNCSGTCTYTSFDSANCGGCGIACAADEVCSNGVCTQFLCCPAGFENCGGTCVSVASNPNHCGACGNQCAAGEYCVNGACSQCPAGYGLCSGTCIDLETDTQNCGSCGNVCTNFVPPGYVRVCNGGTCGIESLS